MYKKLKYYISPQKPPLHGFIERNLTWTAARYHGRNHIFNFIINQLRGFDTVRGQISLFPIGKCIRR